MLMLKNGLQKALQGSQKAQTHQRSLFKIF